MDKQFWLSIKTNDFAFPAGYAILPLTEELFTYIASTDPELRDTIGLEAFYRWLDQGLYRLDDIRGLIPRLVGNWQKGLGEAESDSVFQRSFTSLWLALIIENDIKQTALKGEDLAPILESFLIYFKAERDLRGFVPIKGWAHAIAHGADLLGALACSTHTDAGDHAKILNCIADKLRDSTHWVYIYGEDARLASPVLEILARGTLSMEQIKNWLAFLSADWNNSWWDEARARAYFNGRNFISALHWGVLKSETIPDKEVILTTLRDMLNQIKPFKRPVDN
jgi:hypothetical protein